MVAMAQVSVFGSRTEIAAAALEICHRAYEAAVAARGRFTIVAAGGSTPKVLYELFVSQPWHWSKVHVFWGDERYVPVSDPQSNEGMARLTWLDHVPILPENVHPMPTGENNPAVSAAKYAAELEACFAQWPDAWSEVDLTGGENSQRLPVFDLVLLGMGDDGHTASLFPHTAALAVRDQWVTLGEKAGEPRLTLTVPVINAARQILFMAEGAAKAPALAAVLAESGDAQTYPSRLISHNGRGNVTWLVDHRAMGAE